MLTLTQLKTKINADKYVITKSKNTTDIEYIGKYLYDLEEENIFFNILQQIIKFWKGTNHKIMNLLNLNILEKYISKKNYEHKKFTIAGTYDFVWYNYNEDDIRPENIFKLNFKLISDKLNEYFKDVSIKVEFEKSTSIDRELKKSSHTYKHDVLFTISSKTNENEKPYEIVLEYFERKHNRFNDDDKSISARLFTDVYGIFDEKNYSTNSSKTRGIEKFFINTLTELIKIICAINNDKYELSKLLYLKNNKASDDEKITFNKIIEYKKKGKFNFKKFYEEIMPTDSETGDIISQEDFIEILKDDKYKIKVANIKHCPTEVFEQIIIRMDSESDSFEIDINKYKRIYFNAINALDNASNEIIKLIKEQRNKRYCLPQFMKNFEKFHRENSKIKNE